MYSISVRSEDSDCRAKCFYITAHHQCPFRCSTHESPGKASFPVGHRCRYPQPSWIKSSVVCKVIILLCCPSNAIRWNHLSDATKRSFERDWQKARMSVTLQLQAEVCALFPLSCRLLLLLSGCFRLISVVQVKVVVYPAEEV